MDHFVTYEKLVYETLGHSKAMLTLPLRRGGGGGVERIPERFFYDSFRKK